MIEQQRRRRNLKNCALWTPADIRAEIVRRGSTPSKVALAAGLSARGGRAALTSPRYVSAEIAIAAFLGLCPAEIWPERYASGSLAARSPARQRALEMRAAGRAA